jgi:hypothetical protein
VLALDMFNIEIEPAICMKTKERRTERAAKNEIFCRNFAVPDSILQNVRAL